MPKPMLTTLESGAAASLLEAENLLLRPALTTCLTARTRVRDWPALRVPALQETVPLESDPAGIEAR
jgi:hypothetical protein